MTEDPELEVEESVDEDDPRDFSPLGGGDPGRDRYVYVPKKPSDLLAERRTAMSRVTERAGLKPPTLEELKKHAERFGVDQVIETAVELGYGEDTLVRLQDALDRIERAHYKAGKKDLLPVRKGVRAGSRPKPAEERVKVLLGIDTKEPEAAAA